MQNNRAIFEEHCETDVTVEAIETKICNELFRPKVFIRYKLREMIVKWIHAESCILMYPFPAQLKQQWNLLCVPADTTVPLAWLKDGSFHVPLAPSRVRSESRLLRAAFPVLLVRKAAE